jgi:hypothetical protein
VENYVDNYVENPVDKCVETTPTYQQQAHQGPGHGHINTLIKGF